MGKPNSNIKAVNYSMHDINHEGLSGMIKALEHALEFSSASDEYLHLAIKYFNAGKLDIAESILYKIINKYPNCYNSLNILGLLFNKKHNFLEASNIFKRAIKICPSEKMAWINLGNSYAEVGNHTEATRCFDMAVIHNPKNAEAFRAQGLWFAKIGTSDLALKALELAVLYEPYTADIVYDYITFHYNQQQYDKGLALFKQAKEELKSLPDFVRLKAILLKACGETIESVALLEKVIQQNPKDTQALMALARIYCDVIGDMANASRCFNMLYMEAANDPLALQAICHFLFANRRPEGATKDNLDNAYDIALKILEMVNETLPYSWILQSVFLYVLDYDSYEKLGDPRKMMSLWVDNSHITPMLSQMARVKSMNDRRDLLLFHRAWGDKLEKKAAEELIVKNPRKRLNNKIRVGIASSYIRNAPVGFFVWPLIEHLNRDKFEIYCYCANPAKADHIQMSAISLVNQFKKFKDESAKEIAQSISDDHIDILFELGGVTGFSLVSACSYKPAPIQVSWLGYPHSVRLPSTIDYIVVDPYIVSKENDLILEKPFMLPETWVSLDKVGFTQVPITSLIPEVRNGHITFGTLNSSYKYTKEAIEVWANIMNMVPNSRFLCMNCDALSKAFQHNFCKLMASHGIKAERISFIATSENHLSYYNFTDIAFDTFPHTGGTTTCEALWMGVPVITLVGPAFYERISYSNLNNFGLADLCAFNLQQYKDITMELVINKERRQYLRNHLRTQIINHPLGQPKKFVENFDKTISNILGR